MKYLFLAMAGILMMLPTFASASLAAMTEKDALVITRIIQLLQNFPENKAEIAVVANTPASREDAQGFVTYITHKHPITKSKLKAFVVSPEDLETTTANVIIIPDSFDAAQFDVVFDVARKRKLATISTSEGCLKAQRCAISFKSDPAVDIRMSQTVAAETGVSFSPTLRMMIKEVP